MHHLLKSVYLQFVLQLHSHEPDATRQLMDLLLKKSNQQFDEFCISLYETEQTHVVKNQLTTQGTCLFI